MFLDVVYMPSKFWQTEVKGYCILFSLKVGKEGFIKANNVSYVTING